MTLELLIEERVLAMRARRSQDLRRLSLDLKYKNRATNLVRETFENFQVQEKFGSERVLLEIRNGGDLVSTWIVKHWEHSGAHEDPVKNVQTVSC